MHLLSFMKCLWLTLADPDPPENGQYLYSGGLIRAIAAAGSDLHVVGLARHGGAHRAGGYAEGIRWSLAKHRTCSEWASLFSAMPQIVIRTRTPEMRTIIRDLLEREQWDGILFDSISVGWALSSVLARFRSTTRHPRVVYLSHNHEENVARRIARDERDFLRGMVRRFDALKVARVERTLMRHADFITSNSPEDCRQFRMAWPNKRIDFLPPGYRGPRLVAREITHRIPRRAIIVGSFDWVPKRASLENFLRIADPLFARAGVELCIVGSAENSYLERMRKTVIATTFTGRVDDIHPHMAQSRVAVVPDQLGGFKLKALDYVFNRLPILAINGSVPGMPLRHEESILLYADHRTLAHGILQVIDDFETLNRMQNSAYSACHDKFDWNAIGRRLISAMHLVEDFQPLNGTTAPLPTTI